MADDDLLVNFSLDVGPLKSRPVFKGGRWKDRLHAKNGFKRNSSSSSIPQPHKSLTGPNALLPEKARQFGEESGNERAAKRHKTSNGDPHARSNNQAPIKPKPTNGAIVSSLFTSNPTTTSKPILFKPSDGRDTSTSPSNAPLPSNLHNFTSLGLSPGLSTHLLQTLSLTAPTAIQKATIPHLLNDPSDAFIQAETGSGKTLAYLLPLLQHILSLKPSTPSSSGAINRKSGLFALILAPTRELTHQIFSVLDKLLRKFPHVVAGSVTGGATKNHEKARLRKGLNILVATPGRLADHLENTEVLDLAKVRWLVLDEGDRLMEMGFEEEVKKVVKALEGKREAMEGKMARLRKAGKVWGGAGPEGKVFGGRVPEEVTGLPERMVTVLCSATMKMGVQRLGEMSLRDAVLLKVDPMDDDHHHDDVAKAIEEATEKTEESAANGARDGQQTVDGGAVDNKGVSTKSEKAFQAPAQLKQSYIITPAKQRLVTLAALLKRTFARKGSVQKAIVFVSCAHSVEFHFEVFARKTAQELDATDHEDAVSRDAREGDAQMNDRQQEAHSVSPPPASSVSPSKPNGKSKPSSPKALPTLAPAPSLTSPTNPSLALYKLHGSLTQQLRTSTLDSFRKTSHPSILICTDVASRGLDLPNIDLVIEYDPPFSGEEHLHRVGRTARAGKEGRAICFLMPGAEERYVEVLQEGSASSGGTVKGEGAEEVLRKGFASPPSAQRMDGSSAGTAAGAMKWDVLATEWQLDVERWVVEDQRAAQMARKAFVSHVRAYATHVAKERYMFDVKELHLGHLAKAFALREKPGSMGRGGGGVGGGRKDKGAQRARGSAPGNGNAASSDRTDRSKKAEHDIPSSEGQGAARKMRAKMKEQTAGGASEFNIG